MSGEGSRRLPPPGALLELLALCGFALAQPLLDVFGRSPEQFAFRDADRWGIIAFGLAVVLGPAAVLYAVEAVVGLVAGQRVRSAVHVVLLGALAAVLALQLVKGAGPVEGAALVAVVVAVGAAFAAAFVRWPVLRSWVRFASVAPVAFLVLFLVASPVADLVRGGGTGAAAASVGRAAPVVVLVLDELPLASLMTPEGQLDAERYPGFAALAAQTTWYRNATTVSNTTVHALPSMLTGRYPRESSPIAEDHPDNLFTLLGDDYRLDVDESVTRLCPTDLCDDEDRPSRLSTLRALGSDAGQVLRERLSLEDDDGGGDVAAGLIEEGAEEEGGAPAPGLGAQLRRNDPRRFTAFLDGLTPSDRPALHYLHLLLPHQPWRYTPSGVAYPFTTPDPGKLEDRWPEDPWPAELGRQRHLLQLQYVDGLVASFVDRLRDTGLLEEAVIAVVSDHGVAFQPGQPTRGLVEGPVSDVHPELLWVPMFLKLPGGGGGAVDDANVELVDLVPTIADALDADLPRRVDGRSVLAAGREQDAPKTFFQGRLEGGGAQPGERTEVDPVATWPLVLQRTPPASLRGTDPLAAYRVGPAPELVGQPVDDLDVGPGVPVTAAIDRPGRLRDVERATGEVPALVLGRLSGPVEEPVVLALNGQVAAVVPTFGAAELAALVPVPMFRDGGNQLDLYLLDDDGDLRPIERSS